ncbi:hypothetical protein SAV14893_096290 [Streptomyces avermitilis]|uniref:Uncharacterized protein n=2 Tax=Streptomyces avermitilis TaxID=33903 RepID=A0A143SZU0_STRAW|nr:hypothetical protein SAVERM_2p125 [Streptomyces avermitilis MA-4680 = NBRC 14893]GDY70236.1 hypothetical protein SAV14893_096290 [Streptomyces avermitilis]GDY80543.1 hypothetical protein SAV31267_100280 [Streptomyces avermitilis]
MLTTARTDPPTARQLLALLTIGCRTLDHFEKERVSLHGEGVPAEFLPSAGELGRLDLIGRCSTSLEVEHFTGPRPHLCSAGIAIWC